MYLFIYMNRRIFKGKRKDNLYKNKDGIYTDVLVNTGTIVKGQFENQICEIQKAIDTQLMRTKGGQLFKKDGKTKNQTIAIEWKVDGS